MKSAKKRLVEAAVKFGIALLITAIVFMALGYIAGQVRYERDAQKTAMASYAEIFLERLSAEPGSVEHLSRLADDCLGWYGRACSVTWAVSHRDTIIIVTDVEESRNGVVLLAGRDGRVIRSVGLRPFVPVSLHQAEEPPTFNSRTGE